MRAELSRRPLARVLLASAVGFVLYGGWAAIANREHGAAALVRAGVVQGLSSAVSTGTMSSIIEAFAARLGDRPSAPALAALTAATLASVLHTTVHLLAGTASLARTLAVPVTMAYVYAAAYALALRRVRRESAERTNLARNAGSMRAQQ